MVGGALTHSLLSAFHRPTLALSLFMFGVFADHPDDPFPFYDLTFITDFFDGCPDFHFRYPVV